MCLPDRLLSTTAVYFRCSIMVLTEKLGIASWL
jgi:hypothetical protein